MKLPTCSLAFLAGISLVTPALAVINIDFVSVGDAGNAADNSTGYGAVAYAYQIGKYEVTNSQYTEFLNAADPSGANANGIYNTSMGSDARGGISFNAGAASGEKYTIRTSMGDKPVNYVSWYDSARFTNWLYNGQGAVALRPEPTPSAGIPASSPRTWEPPSGYPARTSGIRRRIMTRRPALARTITGCIPPRATQCRR